MVVVSGCVRPSSPHRQSRKCPVRGCGVGWGVWLWLQCGVARVGSSAGLPVLLVWSPEVLVPGAVFRAWLGVHRATQSRGASGTPTPRLAPPGHRESSGTPSRRSAFAARGVSSRTPTPRLAFPVLGVSSGTPTWRSAFPVCGISSGTPTRRLAFPARRVSSGTPMPRSAFPGFRVSWGTPTPRLAFAARCGGVLLHCWSAEAQRDAVLPTSWMLKHRPR